MRHFWAKMLRVCLLHSLPLPSLTEWRGRGQPRGGAARDKPESLPHTVEASQPQMLALDCDTREQRMFVVLKLDLGRVEFKVYSLWLLTLP